MPRCHVTDDATDAAGYPAAPAASPGPGPSTDDGGPRARTRGNFRGFLPANVAADLRASVDSGAGLALMDQVPSSASSGSCSPLLALAAGVLLVLALR